MQLSTVQKKENTISNLFLWFDPFGEELLTTAEAPSIEYVSSGEELFIATSVSSIASHSSCIVFKISSEASERYNFKIFEAPFGRSEISLAIPQKSFKREPVVIPSDAREFAISKNLVREIDLLMDVICDCYDFNKFEIELVSDYETDFQQICFLIHLKISYDKLIKLRKRFNQKLNMLNMPIEKEKYFVFDYEREEP